MTTSEQITAKRFSEWAVQLSDMQAVPMLVICAIIGEKSLFRGQIITVNSQGKTPEEVLEFLKDVTAQLEAQLQ